MPIPSPSGSQNVSQIDQKCVQLTSWNPVHSSSTVSSIFEANLGGPTLSSIWYLAIETHVHHFPAWPRISQKCDKCSLPNHGFRSWSDILRPGEAAKICDLGGNTYHIFVKFAVMLENGAHAFRSLNTISNSRSALPDLPQKSMRRWRRNVPDSRRWVEHTFDRFVTHFGTHLDLGLASENAWIFGHSFWLLEWIAYCLSSGHLRPNGE
jgi:hypothetical protein